jgi:hypothetical protein
MWMVMSDIPSLGVYRRNFYNVPKNATGTDAQIVGLIREPSSRVSRDVLIKKSIGSTESNTRKYRDLYQKIATITYDRSDHDAIVEWHAEEYKK